jgi:hypothetical protein
MIELPCVSVVDALLGGKESVILFLHVCNQLINASLFELTLESRHCLVDIVRAGAVI